MKSREDGDNGDNGTMFCGRKGGKIRHIIIFDDADDGRSGVSASAQFQNCVRGRR